MFPNVACWILLFLLLFSRYHVKGTERKKSGTNQQAGSSTSKSKWLSPMNPFMKPDDFIELGTQYLNEQDYNRALKMFNKAITGKSVLAEYFKIRGDCYLKMGYTDKALEDYREWIKRDPKKENRRFLIQTLVNDLAKYPEAIEATRNLDEKGEEFLQLGNSFFAKRMYDPLAIDCYNEAIELWVYKNVQNVHNIVTPIWNPTSQMERKEGLGHGSLCLYGSRGVNVNFVVISCGHRYDHSILHGTLKALCNSFAGNRNATEASYYKQRGNCYRELGVMDKAIEDYKQALFLKSDDNEVKSRLCDMLLNSGRYREAVDVAFHLSHSRLVELANNLFREEQFEEASRCFTEAIRRNPEQSSYYKDRGYCYRQTGHLEWAIQDYRQLIKMVPSSVPGRIELCEMLLETEQIEECMEVLKHVNRQLLWDEEAKRLDRAYKKMEEIEEAQKRAKIQKLLNYSKDLIIKDIALKTQQIREDSSLRGQHIFQEGQRQIEKLNERCAKLLEKLEHAFDVFIKTGVPFEARTQLVPDNRTVPSFLQDPILQDLIGNPYTTPAGHTYDRQIILETIRVYRRCPMTRAALADANLLRPNIAIREALRRWNEESGLRSADDLDPLEDAK